MNTPSCEEKTVRAWGQTLAGWFRPGGGGAGAGSARLAGQRRFLSPAG